MRLAQQDTLKSAAQKAVLSNPEVLQKWHAYQATDNERDVAFGGYLPRVDLTAGIGRENRDDPIMVKDYTRRSTTLTLTQMLYDGFATRNEVKRLDHARQVSFFELLDASETVALEASRAYLDVLRYRKLVTLAEDNYIRHRAVFEQIQKKAQAGVGAPGRSGAGIRTSGAGRIQPADRDLESARRQRALPAPGRRGAGRGSGGRSGVDRQACRPMRRNALQAALNQQSGHPGGDRESCVPPMPPSTCARPPTSRASTCA